MIVELQIDADALCKNFREQMRKAVACKLTEDVFDLNPADAVPGTPYVITGYTVGQTTLRRAQNAVNVCIHTGAANVTTHRPVKRPQILQPLVVHISWVHELRAANTAKAPDIPITLPLVFELGMETCGNMRVLCFHYIGLDSGVDQAMAAKLGQQIQTTCTWLPVDRVIAAYLPSDVALVNAHLTMNELRTCFAVRMEFWEEKWGAATGDTPRTVAEWDLFYNSHFIDRLQHGDVRDGWSIFIDQRALTHYVRETILDSSGGDLAITRQPNAVWLDSYKGAKANCVRVDMEVEKKNACWCFTEDLDVEAEVTADVVISVPAEDKLRIDIYADISLNDWDAGCCVLTAALFWPILGAGYAIKGKIDVETFYGGFLPFAALIGAIGELNKATSEFKPPTGFTQDPADKTHAFREEKLDLPNDPGLGKMTLRGAMPIADPATLKASGLYLYGGLETFSPPQPTLENPDLEPFCWGKAGRCSRRVAASTRFRLNPVNPQHWAQLQVCEVRVLDDPLGVFDVEVIRELHSLPDVKVTVDFWGMDADYWKHPYPCQLMVKTTGGVRILTLPPLPALTEEQFKSLYLGIQLEYVNECYLPRHRLFEELEWPIEVLIEQPGLHHWQVRAIGLEPGERVQVLDARGRPVAARFFANRTGAVVVNALGVLPSREHAQPIFTLRRLDAAPMRQLPPMQTMSRRTADGLLGGFSTRPICGPDAAGSFEEMVKIRRTEFADLVAEHTDSSREVIVRQTLLKERGRISPSGECLALSLDVAEGRPRVVVVTSGMVEAYDASDADAPRLAGAWRAVGVRGAIVFGDRLLFWGHRGIWIAGEQPASAPFSRCGEDPVLGVAAARGRLYVLRAGDLRVYAPDLCEQDRHACRASHVATLGDHVVLGNDEGIRVCRAGGSLDEAVRYPLRGVSRLDTPPIPLGVGVVYVRGPEGGRLVTAAGECVAEYEGGAWFEGVVRVGRLLAVRERRTVRLMEVARSVQSE